MKKLDAVLLVLSLLVLIGGLWILLYPAVKTARFRQMEHETIRQFEDYRNAPGYNEPDLPDLSLHGGSVDPAASPERAFSDLWEACSTYNQKLTQTRQAELTAETLQQSPIRLPDYGWTQEVFGYVSIPSAGIEAPLYLGASMSNLYKGAAVLGQTSLPIGGKSTNCVIAGHRTWDGILHPFIGLEKVGTGDLVRITNPWETLTYRVISVDIISPDSLDQVRIQNGKDLVSVFTCTYPNTHRILVTCERIKEE